MNKFVYCVALVYFTASLLSGINGDKHDCNDDLPNGFLCYENLTTNAVKKCQWKDGIIEEAIVERQVSPAGKCSNPSNQCVLKFPIDYSLNATVRSEFEVDEQPILDFQPNIDSHFNAEARLVIDLACEIEPGCQTEVWIRAPLRRFRGNVEYEQSTRDEPGESTCDTGAVRVDSPSRTQNGSLVDQLECRQKPLANITDVSILVNTRSITSPNEAEAVKIAVKKVADTVPSMNEAIVKTSIFNDMQAWAYGRCYNMSDPETYRAICGACLRYLSENILSRVDNAYGARWKTHDCILRYEFYEIDALSPEDDELSTSSSG